MEFNLASVAALLTIVGYSSIYDRVRENLRKFKAMPMRELLDRSINETLARTVMTSGTTLLALLALAIFGGPVIRGFAIAMIWGADRHLLDGLRRDADAGALQPAPRGRAGAGGRDRVRGRWRRGRSGAARPAADPGLRRGRLSHRRDPA